MYLYINRDFSSSASSKFQLALTPPDFSQHRVEDLFRSLGPIAVFSAKRHWSAPRLVTLHRHAGGPRRRDGAGDDDYVTKQNGVYISSFDGEYHRSRAREAGRAPADGEGFGFTVRGDAPVMVAAVEQDSLADVSHASKKETFVTKPLHDKNSTQ